MVTSDDIKPHLCTTLFITGSFLIAWSWDLALYGASHLFNGTNPLQAQLGFGNRVAPTNLFVLILEYVLVVGLSAYVSFLLSTYCQGENGRVVWSRPGAIMAVEFLPAPFFAGKLMAYLENFSGLSAFDQAIINFGATAFCAMLAFAVNTTSCRISLGDGSHQNYFDAISNALGRFPHVLANTLGFGLGIAWNACISQVLLGSHEQKHEMDILQVIALFGYLLVVTLIAFRLAAHDDAESTENPTIWQRQVQLLSFAFHVVCAFSLVAFLNSILHSGWIGAVESLVILVALSAIMPAIVASVDLDDATSSSSPNDDEEEYKVGLGSCCLLDVLVFVPCVWCICPWVPLAWLLAGMNSDVGVKERWYKLIAFVSGLAASIQASSMLTAATNGLASLLGICNSSHCRHPWTFVSMQVICAVITTTVLLLTLPYVTQSEAASGAQTTGETQALLGNERQQRERKSLVGRAKSFLSKGKKRKSSQSEEATNNEKGMKIQVHGSISFDP